MNSKIKKWILFFLILIFSFPLSAVSIEKLESDPQRYNGDIVRLRGNVTHKVGIPFTELCVYVLTDRTGSIMVFSPFPKEKEERISIKAEVVAYIGEENEEEREKTIERIKEYLIEKEILKEDAARRVSEISLRIINTISDAATGTWFVIEQEKSGFFNI